MGGTIGSNFDVASIVNELMKKESVPLNRLKDSEARQEIKLSIFGQLKNIVDSLKISIDKISDAFNVISYSASVENSNILSAKISSNDNVFPSTHNIVVSKLAAAETRGSVTTFASRIDALSQSGNLSFTMGASAFTVNVDATDSLEKIRDKINSASDNNGVTANIISSTNGSGDPEYSLVVSSNKTGVENKVTIAGSLSTYFDFSNVVSDAQNAEFTFDGKSVVRAENIVNDVMDGVSFTLLQVGTTKLNISSSDADRNAAVINAIKDAVKNYNQTLTAIDQNIADGLSVNDSTMNMVKMMLRDIFNSTLSNAGKFTTLLDIGIHTAETKEAKTSNGNAYTTVGLLEVDEAKLNSIMTSQASSLKTFFLDKSNGFLKLSDGAIDKITQFGGTIPSKTLSIQEEITQINRKISNEESKLALVKTELTKKYAALGAIMDKFDNISKYLDSQFASMDSSRKK